ncbi:MAG: CPBP family intramembrane metalloprotease [Clostridia bacterium]|nr:CPBP family intramembrane metalloprotease [Clostridia bacterium]
MTKKLYKLFLWIPLIFALFLSIAYGVLSSIAIKILSNPEIEFQPLIQILFNILLLLLQSIVYFLIYKIILLKCDFSFGLIDSLREEWKERKKTFEILKVERKYFLIIFLLILLCQISWIFFCVFLSKKLETPPTKTPFLDISYLIVPIFEEFICRKIYFTYCNYTKEKDAYFHNVLIFSFLHMAPMPPQIALAIMLTHCYKKYESLSLNILIHFVFNFIGIFSGMIIKSLC